MVCVDVWSRYAVAVPMKSKRTDAMLSAWGQVVEKMGVPRNLNTDEEGAVMGEPFQKKLEEPSVKHWAWGPEKKQNNMIVERLNRTLRQTLRKFMRARKTKAWTTLPSLMAGYNEQYHDAVQGEPQEIWNEGQLPDPKTARQWTRKDLQVGDRVRVMKSYDVFEKKSDAKTYTKNVYVVTAIEGKRFILQSPKGKEVSKMGYELLRVDGEVEDRSAKDEGGKAKVRRG